MNDKIIFICTDCGLCVKQADVVKTATSACSHCNCGTFQVLYANQPYGGLSFRTTPKNPYHRDEEEDGYNFTTPFDENDASNAALGNGANSGSVGLFHEPGDPWDRNTSGGSSDNFMPNESPLRKEKQKEPFHLGPHNMPRFNIVKDSHDLFERVRRLKRKHV